MLEFERNAMTPIIGRDKQKLFSKIQKLRENLNEVKTLLTKAMAVHKLAFGPKNDTPLRNIDNNREDKYQIM